MPNKKPPKDKQFKKGQSGNPNGRPKGSKNLTCSLKSMLNKTIENYDPITKKKTKKTINDHIIDVLLAKALSGEDRAIQEIYDRIEGRAIQSIDNHIDGEINQNIKVEYIDTNPEDI